MITLAEHKICYAPAPKNACTSLKEMFFYIENGFHFKNLKRNGKKYHIHKFYTTPKFDSISEDVRKSFWKVAVVRDPIKRAISAYSNRVVFHKELSERYLNASDIARGATPNPSLEEFLEKFALYRKVSKSVFHHTLPQVYFLGSDKNFYDRTFKVNELNNLRVELEVRVGKSLILPHSQSGGPKISEGDISAQARKKLLKFYEEDYDSYEF